MSASRDGAIPTRRRPKVLLTLGFTLSGLLIILYSAWRDPIFQISTSADFGLYQLLPPTFWIGLGMLGISVVLAASYDSDFLFVIVGALFLGTIAVAPVLFEPNAPVWDSYIHFASMETIVRTGRIPTDPTEYSANWPGFFVSSAYAYVLGGLPALQMVGLFPFFSGFITFLSMFVFLRAFWSARLARPASLLSTLLNVWAQFHFSPQGVGLALSLLVLATVWEHRVSLRVANAVLFLGLVVSHATSAIFLLVFFGFDAALAFILPRRWSSVERSESTFGPRFNPFLVCAAVFLGWLFFVASGSSAETTSAIIGSMGRILSLGDTAAGVVAARTVQNIYVVPPEIRLAAIGLFGFVSLVALTGLLSQRHLRGHARFLTATLLGITFLALADILSFRGLFSDRAFMFFSIMTPGLCLYGLRRFSRRPSLERIVLVVLIAGSLASASTLYYQEAFYFVSSQSVSMSEFMTSHANRLYVVDGLVPSPIWLLDRQPSRWLSTSFYVLYPSPFSVIAVRSECTTSPCIAIFDPTARLWYVQGHGLESYRFYEAQRANYSLIYDNGLGQAYLLA